VSIVESAESYKPSPELTMPVEMVPAQPSGDIALADRSIDLLTCFGVLHHIPNVSHVITEFARVLQPGGIALIREPVISMGGDWGHKRPRLTPHERGIPLGLLEGWLAVNGLRRVKRSLVVFGPISRLWRLTGEPPYNSRLLTALDRQVCRALTPNLRYHATSRLQKLRPTNVSLVVEKR
jgi:SAM-dependent methyltransferase